MQKRDKRHQTSVTRYKKKATSREPQAMSLKKQIWDLLLRLSPLRGLGGVAARWVKSGELRVKSNLGTSLKFQASRKNTSTRQSKIYNLKSCVLNHQRLVQGIIFAVAFTLLFQSTAPAFALTTSIDFTTPSDYTLEDSSKVELSEGKLQLSGGDTTETVEDVFSTYLYEGNGSSQTIENGIDLEGEGGMVWLKMRDGAASHRILDTETPCEHWNWYLSSDSTNSQACYWGINHISNFNSNGFDLGVDYNNASYDYASWTFREAPGFFDIVTYTGDGQSGREIAHELGVEPGMIIVKRLDNQSEWSVFAPAIGTQTDNLLILNRSDSNYDHSAFFGDYNSSHFVVNGWNGGLWAGNSTNLNGYSYVAYLFAHDPSEDGKIQCGSYTGNGSMDGPEVNLGWEPQWIMVKNSSAISAWLIDNKMTGLNMNDSHNVLFANATNAESWSGFWKPTSQGFKVENATNVSTNQSGNTYIYCAIRAPQKEPVNSSEVFDVGKRTWVTSIANSNSSILSDASWTLRRDSSTEYNLASTRFEGLLNLQLQSTESEWQGAISGWDTMNGIKYKASNWATNLGDLIDYSFKRAPGFFDVVAYEGDGVAGRTVEHNLGVEPEMMIVKRRSNTDHWFTYHTALGNTFYTALNLTSPSGATAAWNDTNPTDNHFSLGSISNVNYNNEDYISYLFATIPDVSKVGSYTGTAGDLDIDAGFTNGTKFVLIKRTDSTGDWYLYDAERGIVEGNDPYLLLNTTDAEVTNTDYIDPIDSGFRITSSAPAALNASGGEYIYLAIANDNGKVRGAYPTDKAYTTTTNATTQIDSSTWADINSVSVTETVPAEVTEVPEAVDFDGENDYLSRSSDLVGNTDSKTFTFSGWVYHDSNETAWVKKIYTSADNTSQQGEFLIYTYPSNGQLYIMVRQENSTTVDLSLTANTNIPFNTWTHIVISIDMNNPSNRSIYVNDEPVSVTWHTYNNTTVNLSTSLFGIWKDVVWTWLLWDGRLSNIYLDHTYRDLSQESNRRLFITEDGKPADGQADLNPILYLPLKSAETAGQNLGTGGDFTVNGTLSTSERGPNQYNASASEFDGIINYLQNNNIWASNGKQLSFSFSLMSNEDNLNIIYHGWGYYDIYKNADKTISIRAYNPAGSTIVFQVTTPAIIETNQFINLNLSIDLSDYNKRHLYINGKEVAWVWDTYTNTDMALSASAVRIGYLGDNTINGTLSDFYFDTSYIDLSQNNPFWNSDENKPAYLGKNGELPTGSAPLIYLPLRADDAGKNLGTGGDFTVNGTLEGARGPSEFWANSGEFDGILRKQETNGSNTKTISFVALSNHLDTDTGGKKIFSIYPYSDYTAGTYWDSPDYAFRITRWRNGTDWVWISVQWAYNEWHVSAPYDIFRTELTHPWNDYNNPGLLFFSLDLALNKVYMSYTASNNWTIETVEIDTFFTYNNDYINLSENSSISIWGADIYNIQEGWWNKSNDRFSGEIGFLYFSTNYIDFSQESNRLKFVDALGNPKYIGQNGELPTGSAPLIYMPFKDADNLGYNAGTGGDFTVNGTVTLGSGGPFPNEPTNVNTYAHYAVSFDGRTSFAAFDSAQAAWRSIVRNNAGTWQYNSAASGSETWVSCAVNGLEECLSEAIGIEANQMTGTEFIAISDADWEATGGFESLTTNTIDVAVSLQSESTSMTPNVDIVTFDYDPILNIAPNDPTLNNYNSGSTITDTTPTLSFDMSDPDESEEGEEIKYQIQIDNNADFSSPEVDFTELAYTTSPRAGTEYTASGLSDGQWYWRVKAIDDDGLESNWSEASNGFKIDISLPESKILYPQDGASLKNVNYIFGRSTDSQGVDKTRISIRNLTTGKYYTGTGFTADAETWIDTNPTGANQTRSRWWIAAPTWADFQTYTIRSRAIDMAGNEEHTDAITFTYDTINGSEGSIYVSNPGVDNNSDYTIFYPNTDPLATGDYIEIDFDDTFAFSPWLEDSDVTLSDNSGNITASTDSFDRLNKTITSTITGGNVTGGDIIELAVSNLKIHNPSATWSYALPIRIYNSSDILIEAGTGTITLVENYRQVEVNVNIAESLQLRVDSGSVLLEVDPDVQLGQNWTGTGGAVAEKTEVEVKTNAQGGYNLLISLAGNTATGSAVLDGQTLSGSQITSTTGDRVSIENNFTFGLNTGTSATVTAFTNSATQVSGAGSSNATNSYIDNIFYYLNIDYTTPADTYAGTVTYTAVGQF